MNDVTGPVSDEDVVVLPTVHVDPQPASERDAREQVADQPWNIREPESVPAPSFTGLAAVPDVSDDRPLVNVRPRVRAFRSRADLRRFARRRDRRRAHRGSGSSMAALSTGAIAPTQASPAPSAMSSASNAPSSSASNTGVTTTQIAGIDEGDIVKAMGRHVLVLRRGVLYAVDTDTLEVTGRTNVMPDEEAGGWIDELLVHAPTRRAVVVGFVDGPDGQMSTLMHLFNVNEEGVISRGDAIYLRSDDYYSGENYATRLLGNNLMLYSLHQLRDEVRFEPDEFYGMEADEIATMRAQNRWDATLPAIRNERGRFQATWSPRRIYKRAQGRARTLHAVTRCDLSRTPVPCTTQGVLEDGYAQLFVSPSAAYLWVEEPTLIHEPSDDASEAAWEAYDARFQELESVSALYRFPHGRQRVEVAMARGSLASMMHLAEFDGHLHALVGWSGDGIEEDEDADFHPSDAALLRFNLRSFGTPLRRSDVRRLPSGTPGVGRWSGRRIVYGAGNAVVVHDAATNESWRVEGETTTRVDPIEGGVLVTLSAEDIQYLSVDLQGPPRAHERRRLVGATGGETRTHGFFFLPSGPGAGTFGVPIVRGARGQSRAAIAFFHMDGFETSLAGTIKANDVDVPCTQSCVDWYGNARPVFWRNRIFALMGSEIVEAQRSGTELVEARRTVLQ
ncbi:MAG: beta-propeller domain-containing protein [Myxococcota bacterium]